MPIEWFGESVTANVKRVMVKSLHVASYMVENDAKRLCPVDTGRLRASITHDFDDKQFKALVGSNVHYAKYVEMGTIKMSPQPYLRPALEMNREAIRKLFK